MNCGKWVKLLDPKNSIKVKVSLILLTFVVILSACDDNYRSSIPDMPVHLELNLITNYPIFRNSVNQFLVFTRPIKSTDRIGFGGILVYSGFDMQYHAFDLACPHEVNSSIRVTPNELGQAVCPSCGSVFDLTFGIGNPISGPAKETLRRYRTSLQGDILIVFR